MLHGVHITHPDRIVFEDGSLTKGDVARYYAEVAPLLLRDIKNRPITVVRCPGGIKADCFYQRNVGFGLGQDVYPFHWKYKGSSYKYIYVNDAKGIMEMIQMGVIEIHPWGATIDNIHMPDRMIFDLDPDSSVAFPLVKKAAREVRQRLADAGLESFLKCTGGKGLHVVVPLTNDKKSPDWDAAKAFAKEVCRRLADAEPDRYLLSMAKKDRTGRIFLDYLRNDRTSTAVAPLSPRARDGATVSMPLEWSQVKAGLEPGRFTIRTVPALLRKTKAWRDYDKKAVPLRQAIQALIDSKE